MGIWVVSPFGYGDIAAMHNQYKFLFKHLFSIILGMYSGMELLGHMVILFNFLKILTSGFQKEILIRESPGVNTFSPQLSQ